MGQALYRTYRPKKVSEVLGQPHVTAALTHALQQGTISHAYLFTGPRGTGKTSIARILAHEINQLPYDDDRIHLDIIEIDAASNRRIDEIRDLRDKVHLAPTSAKYKVYIIDEVHMLTKEAFNALLKTLEEPPAHVVFMLATTEAHKLPETIISRTQRYSFKPVELDQVAAHLQHIATEEKIDITKEALELIAAHGEGSFRDSISLLDQVRNTAGKVDLKAVQVVLGIAPGELIADMVATLGKHDSPALARLLLQMHEQGYEAAQIAKQCGAALRQALVEGTLDIDHDTAIKLLTQLVQVPASPSPRIALEIALLDAALSDSQSNIQAAEAKPKEPKVMPEEVQAKPTLTVDAPRPARKDPKSPLIATPADVEPQAGSSSDSPREVHDQGIETNDVGSDIMLTEEAWDIILNAIKQKYNTLYSVAKSAKTHFEPGKITLEVGYAFHQKRLNDVRNKQLLADVIKGVTGSEITIRCIVGETRPPATPLPPADGEVVHTMAPVSNAPAAAPAETTVNTISNIFGGAELIES